MKGPGLVPLAPVVVLPIHGLTAGPEFGELEGHTMIIYKALYGLRRSGAAYHAYFADTMRRMGFTPSYADRDVWMRDAGDCYEYVCCYVDDLLASPQGPTSLL